MPKSVSTNSKKSSTSRRGLKTKADETRPFPNEPRTVLSRVVFPVPTSPVKTTKPFRAAMPYCRQAAFLESAASSKGTADPGWLQMGRREVRRMIYTWLSAHTFSRLEHSRSELSALRVLAGFGRPGICEMTARVGSLVKAKCPAHCARRCRGTQAKLRRANPGTGLLRARHRRRRFGLESGLVGKIWSIHYTELLALLAVLKGGCHGRFVHLR